MYHTDSVRSGKHLIARSRQVALDCIINHLIDITGPQIGSKNEKTYINDLLLMSCWR